MKNAALALLFAWMDPCPPNMSCPEHGLPHSESPLLVRVKADVPAVCVKDIMGGLNGPDVAVCEVFVAGTAGTARERAAAYINLGHAYRWTKDDFRKPKSALAAWDKAISEDSSFAEPHVLKGDVAAEGEDKQLALPFYEKAQSIDPGNWRAVMGPAKIHMKLGQVNEAVALAKKAVEIAPNVGVAHQIYGNILKRAERLDEALAEYRKATIGYDRTKRRLPGVMQEGEPWGAVAHVEMRLGRPSRAAEAISRQIDGLPDRAITPDDLIERAGYYEAAGRSGEAAADYDRAVALFGPGYEQADEYRTRAAMLRATAGNGQEAKGAFRDLLRSGKLQTILRIQVFLRNNGFSEVTIDGKTSAELEMALERCLNDKDCSEALGQPI